MATLSISLKILLPVAAALALGACGGSDDTERTFKAGVTDESGGQLIVTEQTPAVQVNVPQTPMTPVPRSDATPGDAGTEASPTPAPAPAPAE